MTAAELVVRAERRVRGSAFLRCALPYVAGLVLIGGAYCRGKSAGEAGARLTEARRAVATAALVRTAAVETVTVVAHQTAIAASRAKAADALVRIVDPTTLAVQVTAASPPLMVQVPAPVVARIEADSALIEAQAAEILALRTLVVADSVVIRSQRNVIRILESTKAPRCGAKCGFVIGASGLLGLAMIVR